MDRKTFMKNIYSKYWIQAREKEYRFLKYDENLCNFISSNVAKKTEILDVAIGTGFPFGNFFEKNGYKVYGVDIAPILIEKCKNLNPNINCQVGDAENLKYPNNFFSCTYCFHSTSYFTNLSKTIEEMIRVTIPNGLVIFDIQNRNNHEIAKNYNKMLLAKGSGFRKFTRYLKNIFKIIFRKGMPDWTDVIYEVPIYPETIYQHLEKLKIKKYKILVKSNESDKLENKTEQGTFKNYSKILFILRK